MRRFLKWTNLIRDFFELSKTIDGAYLERINQKNRVLIATAAVLTILIECCMVARVLTMYSGLSTPANRTYFAFYLLLIFISVLALVAQTWFKNNDKKQYWSCFIFTAAYLLWNVLLNSYDLYRKGIGSSLTMVMAIVFASILIRFRPQHIILLQCVSYTLFFVINSARIDDKVNASIAVVTAITANLVFHYQQVRSVYHQVQIQEMNELVEKEQLEGAQQYLRRLQNTQKQTAIFHHDMRHTLNLLEQFLQQGELEKLAAFISSSQEKLQNLKTTFYCEHETANLILGSFEERAAGRGIAFSASVSLPEQLPLPDTELCALLCNLLENALHGAAKTPQGTAPRVYIRLVYTNHSLVFLVENTFSGKVRMVQNRPVPITENTAHGFGTQSIIQIAERHQGLYNFETEGTIFRAKVLLQV